MGLDSLLQKNMQNAGLAGIDRLAGNAMYPQSHMDKTQYAVPSQMPTSAEVMQSDYDSPTQPYTGMQPQMFAEGGIARLAYGGTPEEQRTTIADAYQKILGRAPSEGEDIMQWASQIGETGDTIELANRLAQTEEGTAYGKSNPNEVYKGAAELSQFNSPFKDTENPYSNMKYVASHTTPTMEEGQVGVTTHRFQDQNGGVVTVDDNGQPISYEPGRGWYDEQLRANPDAVRGSNYRNQTYLSTGPLDKTYNINGVDVPITAQEFQLDPQTGQFITGKSGDYAPVLMKDKDYNWFDDWGAPAAVIAIPALAAAGVYAAGAYGAGAAGGALGAEGAGALTTTELLGGAGGSFVPTAGSGASFALPAGATAAGSSGFAGISPELAAELGLEGSTSGLSTAGTSGDVLAKMGIDGTAGLTAKQAYAAKMGLDLLSSGLGGGQAQSAGGGNQTVAAAPTIPNVNRFGVTGYSGQMPTSEVQLKPIQLSKIRGVGGDYTFAKGGIANLGSYSDGGQLLKGPGDGMSDNIPAKIGNAQPARLADGEFVIPADVVSHLGNGSTDAGAKQLYAMMDKIRKARTGTKKQGKQINPSKFLL